MVLRLCQHNIGYTADGFYRPEDSTNNCFNDSCRLLVMGQDQFLQTK